MSTTEKVQPVNPEQGGQSTHPEPTEVHFVDPTPTTPLELPTQPSRSLGELIRSRARAIAAGLTTAAVAVGLVALATSHKEAVAGTPVAAGQGGDDAPAAGPLIPGGEKADSPEVAKGSLCDIIKIEDLAKWTTGSRSAFPPKDQIDCDGTIPANTDIPMDIVASGTWDFHESGPSAYPVDYISMQVIKDEMPGGGSVFERRQGYFEEEPHTRMVNGQEVTAMSGNGTTLMKVGDYDVSFTIKMPEGLGGDNPDPSVYSPLHRAELQAAEQLFPTLGLTPEA